MSYPAIPSYGCPYCPEKFFTTYARAAHVAQRHYESPAEREDVRKIIHKDAAK